MEVTGEMNAVRRDVSALRGGLFVPDTTLPFTAVEGQRAVARETATQRSQQTQ